MSTQPNPGSKELIIERLLDGKVLAMTTQDSSRATIDRYVEVVKQEQTALPAGSISYLMADFSRTMAGFNTPYGRARMNELMNWRNDIFTYTAVVIAKGFMVQIARVAINSIRRKNMQTYICFSQEEAQVWLQKMMGKEESKGKTAT